MENSLDINAILKAAGASIIQRRPEHANLIEYRVQTCHQSLSTWEFVLDDHGFKAPETFLQCKAFIAEFSQESNYNEHLYRIVAIVEVK